MRQYIEVSPELRAWIREEFKVSDATVWRALGYLENRRNYEKLKHERIRQFALEHGGRIVRKEYIPECSTEGSTRERLVHTFKNGVVVEVSLKDSSARIYKDNKVVRREKSVTLQGWGNLLYEAQELSNGRNVTA